MEQVCVLDLFSLLLFVRAAPFAEVMAMRRSPANEKPD